MNKSRKKNDDKILRNRADSLDWSGLVRALTMTENIQRKGIFEGGNQVYFDLKNTTDTLI